MTIKFQYTLYGFFLGLCFPVFAVLLQFQIGNLAFNFQNIGEAHHQNPLIYMIDTAPVFLGLFALLGGVSKAKSIELLNEFKHLAEILKNSNSNFKDSSGNVFSKLLDSTTEIRALTQHLMESSTHVYQNISNNKNKAERLNDSTNQLLSSTKDLITLNKSLKVHNDTTYQEVEKFSTLISELSTNFDKIKQIGNEIKILSINSSIEANKYGEAGKSFMVISNQVKNLSESIDILNKKTQEIAVSIKGQITTLHKYIGDQNTDLQTILKLIESIEQHSNHNKNNLTEMFSNLEQSISIQENQKFQFEQVYTEIDQLSEEKANIIDNLRNIINNNSSLITRISSL